MKLTGVELRRIQLPLVAPFRTSFGVQTIRDVLLVRAVTPDAEGWGECVAMSQPVYSSEYVDGAEHVTVNHLLPRIFAFNDLDPDDVALILEPVRGHQMAKAAIEAAIIDADLKARGEPMSAYLGGVSETVEVGVSVGIMDDIPSLLDTVAEYLELGYRRVKLKIEPGWDFEPVKAVRERFGDELLLQVDANTAYTLGEASDLAKLDDFDLLLIEQPLPEEEVRSHAELAAMLKTPICLDESITSARAAADAIAMGACAIVNIKPGRVGGYIEGKKIHDVCKANRVPVWHGGMLETGLGRAANLALASLPNFKLPADISASSRYYKQDITEPFELEGSNMRVPTGPGIGVSPIPDVLESVTTTKQYIAAND